MTPGTKKHVVVCKHCGAENLDHFDRCKGCGAVLRRRLDSGALKRKLTPWFWVLAAVLLLWVLIPKFF